MQLLGTYPKETKSLSWKAIYLYFHFIALLFFMYCIMQSIGLYDLIWDSSNAGF